MKPLLDLCFLNCRRVTFICGEAGVCALGAVVAKHAGDEQLCDQYLTQFKKVFSDATMPICLHSPITTAALSPSIYSFLLE